MGYSDVKADEQRKLDLEISCFNKQLIPFGYRDIEVAVEAAIDAGHDGYWAAEQVLEYVEDTETSLDKVDPCYVVYDAILEEARNDIDQLTGKDIFNYTKEQVEVYGNYMCTTLNYSEKAQTELLATLKNIPETDITPAINWLKEKLNQ